MNLKKITQEEARRKFHGQVMFFGDARDAFVYNKAIDDMENHVPDAGKMVTEIEQALEKATNLPLLQIMSKDAKQNWAELIADFAIEYAREKEREAFDAARETEWVHSDYPRKAYPTFEDYLDRKEKGK